MVTTPFLANAPLFSSLFHGPRHSELKLFLSFPLNYKFMSGRSHDRSCDRPPFPPIPPQTEGSLRTNFFPRSCTTPWFHGTTFSLSYSDNTTPLPARCSTHSMFPLGQKPPTSICQLVAHSLPPLLSLWGGGFFDLLFS